MTARGPKATSRMSKWKAMGGGSSYSLKEIPEYKSARGVFLFQGLSIYAALKPRIDFLQGFVHRIAIVWSIRSMPTWFGSHAEWKTGDGEIGKIVNTSCGDSQSESLPRAIISVLQRKERQARSGSGVHLVHEKKRCSICSNARSRQALPQTRPYLQGTHSLPRPRPLPRPGPREDPPRRPPERRDAPTVPRAAPCWLLRSTVAGTLLAAPPRERLNESGSIGWVGTSMGVVSTVTGAAFGAALRVDPPRPPREEDPLPPRPPRGTNTSSSSSESSSYDSRVLGCSVG